MFSGDKNRNLHKMPQLLHNLHFRSRRDPMQNPEIYIIVKQ